MLTTADYSQVHAARPDDPPFWLRTIRRANPSADHLPSLMASRIRSEIADAKIDPDALASFKALRLNLGVSDIDRSVLLDADAWRRASGLPEPDRGGAYVLGDRPGYFGGYVRGRGVLRDRRVGRGGGVPRGSRPTSAGSRGWCGFALCEDGGPWESW